MQNLQQYLEESCDDCLIKGNCFVYDRAKVIESILIWKDPTESILNKLYECKIKAAIDRRLPGLIGKQGLGK